MYSDALHIRLHMLCNSTLPPASAPPHMLPLLVCLFAYLCHQHTCCLFCLCHGMTSLLSFLIFVCAPPHLRHLLTPSDLVCLPSAASAPTLRCTCATMLCPRLDW